MNINKRIKEIRELKGMTSKDVVSAIEDMSISSYSRIENSRIEPSVTTLRKVAKALDVRISELVEEDTVFDEVKSYDSSLIVKVRLIEELTEEERKIVFSLVDALISKKKLKDALAGVLNTV